jgi:hypothetical protein
MSNDRKFSVAILALSFVLLPPNAFAQQLSQQAARVRQNFDDCFYNSVAAQLKSSRATDYNMVSELAFRACSTEEQAIGALLMANKVQSETVVALVIKIKLDLKKSVRDIAANPNRYLR